MSDRKQSEIEIVERNWQRYIDVRNRGHLDYVDTAKINDNFYLGGGLQWDPEDKAYLEDLNRPVIEMNGIFPAVNTAVGMQIKSRVDIAYKPRGAGADIEKAELLSKVAMQICDDIHYPWIETQVFADGLIQQRGYFDFRVKFDENMQGHIECRDLDPLDVIPDPDANGYDPDTWNDVTVLRWMTVDDIEELYGQKKADQVASFGSESVAGGQDDYVDRSRFGDDSDGEDYATREDFTGDDRTKKYLVIDRQYKKLVMQKVIVTAVGDIHPVDDLTKEQIDKLLKDGSVMTKRMQRRIRWTVSTADVLLHDDWSPYKTYTVIPYFPYFRRGKTRGMVDNARSPQENLNKNVSLYQHIVAGIANTGWVVEEGSLTNMETDDLADHGSKTGLVIEYKKGSTKPEKIDPPAPPHGIDRMIDRSELAIKTITGMSDAMQGLNGREISGKAIETKQYQGQAQLGGPMDNLARTRHLVALKLLELIQHYYTEERVIMITDRSDFTGNRYTPLQINAPQPDGSILNDVTIGDYDVVITSQPTSDTFRDNQFQQAMEMRKEGIAIPDTAIVEMSNLVKKNDIAQAIEQAQSPAPDPEAEAKAEERAANAELKRAQAEKTKAETVNKAVDAQYSAMQAAGVITQDPATAPLADSLLRSAGYEDKDRPPIVPQYQGGGSSAVQYLLPPNTDPTTPVPVPAPAPGDETGEVMPEPPASPVAGVNAGIETQEID